MSKSPRNNSEKTEARAQQELRRLELEKTYVDGKMRRYGLLFSVNGGAFVIVSALDKLSDLPIDPGHIAVGAMLFTLLMFFDILFYGMGMKRLEKSWVDEKVIPLGPNTPEGQPRLFGLIGVIILVCLILLIITGCARCPWSVRQEAGLPGLGDLGHQFCRCTIRECCFWSCRAAENTTRVGEIMSPYLAD